ncbi:hypothetical protein ACVLD2_003738 [Paenibacillus sp. PvR052]
MSSDQVIWTELILWFYMDKGSEKRTVAWQIHNPPPRDAENVRGGGVVQDLPKVAVSSLRRSFFRGLFK